MPGQVIAAVVGQAAVREGAQVALLAGLDGSPRLPVQALHPKGHHPAAPRPPGRRRRPKPTGVESGAVAIPTGSGVAFQRRAAAAAAAAEVNGRDVRGGSVVVGDVVRWRRG